MQATINHTTGIYQIDLRKPIDISIPINAGTENVNAFYAAPVSIEPFRIDSFVGSVKEGGAVNYNNIFFNPHGNGTHTECVGHISIENFSINQCLKDFFFLAKLVSVNPEVQENGDRVITKKVIEELINKGGAEAIIIRTLPNNKDKLTFQYTETNPPYLHHLATEHLLSLGFKHLLIDTPSVDREVDDGKLLSHHTWWQYPTDIRAGATITEMVYVDNSINDGLYFLNIQIASFENDASPSKPILYSIS